MTEVYLGFWEDDMFASLTPAQMKFVQTYVETDDAVEAAKTAYPERTNPYGQALTTLKSERVRGAIARARATIIDYIGMNRAAIVRELEPLARFNIKDYYHEDGTPKKLAELTDREARALGDTEFALSEAGTVLVNKIKTTKMEALKVLAKATGMLDKGSGEPPAVFNIDMKFSQDAVKAGVKVTTGGHVLDIKTTDG